MPLLPQLLLVLLLLLLLLLLLQGLPWLLLHPGAV
jgi:hypothetical protein